MREREGKTPNPFRLSVHPPAEMTAPSSEARSLFSFRCRRISLERLIQPICIHLGHFSKWVSAFLHTSGRSTLWGLSELSESMNKHQCCSRDSRLSGEKELPILLGLKSTPSSACDPRWTHGPPSLPSVTVAPNCPTVAHDRLESGAPAKCSLGSPPQLFFFFFLNNPSLPLSLNSKGKWAGPLGGLHNPGMGLRPGEAEVGTNYSSKDPPPLHSWVHC